MQSADRTGPSCALVRHPRFRWSFTGDDNIDAMWAKATDVSVDDVAKFTDVHRLLDRTGAWSLGLSQFRTLLCSGPCGTDWSAHRLTWNRPWESWLSKGEQIRRININGGLSSGRAT